ncbi:hypothetical protein ACMDCR_23760 [Labrys okinawensis]|uniref:hypothetical protein n=1 Tax=Labrys okinawensis TaxID=346911 RepID=UPI0039BC91EF
MNEIRLPPAGWLPVAASWRDDMLWVDWSHFGDRPLSEPFFDDEVQNCLHRPFNRLFRYATPIAHMPDFLKLTRHLQPDGFIFHMSRCGSTLVSQMLGGLPGSIVVSEAGPIDAVVNARGTYRDLSEDEHALWLRWMICAFGQARSGDERLFIVKLDSWHTRNLALFRRAFPDVPWIFLYRDPVEVLVSHLRRTGMQMVPALVGAERLGLNPSDAWQAPATYCVQVLARICEPISQLEVLDGGLLINYRQLPAAVSTSIMPHFGIVADNNARATLSEIASRNAKIPGLAFVNDSVAKQHEASANARDLVKTWLDSHYHKLEAIRLGATGRAESVATPRTEAPSPT